MFYGLYFVEPKATNSKYSMQIPSGIPPEMHSDAFIAHWRMATAKHLNFMAQEIKFRIFKVDQFALEPIMY